MSAHAILSPSSAKRWLNCPPSALINAAAPQRDTVYTAEGTLAHMLAELKARQTFLGLDPRASADMLMQIRSSDLWQDEMMGHTDAYVEALKDIAAHYPAKPHIALEQELDFSEYVPDGHGTADCIMIGHLDSGDVLNVIDFKYGKGVSVEARENPQMMLYALGALLDYEPIYDIQLVCMTIVQPRIKAEPDTWMIPVDQLRDWAESTVKPAAQLAIHGKGEFAEGEWCRFCAIRGSCRARAAANTALEDFGFREPPELTPAEVGRALALGQRLESWLADLQAYALGACLDGTEIPGYKAVAGRSVRAWTDQTAAFGAALAAGVPEAMLYERKPVTLAALEKVMGKKPFADALGGYVTTPEGKPTLVPDTDRRPPITRATPDDDFKDGDTLPF